MAEKFKNITGTIKSFFGYLVNVFRLYKYIWKYSKSYVIFSIFMIFVDTGLLYSDLIFLKLIIDELTQGKNVNRVITYVIAMCGISLILKLIENIYSCFNEKHIEQFKVNFIFEIQEKTMGLSYRQIEDPNLIDQRQKAMEIFYPKQAAFMNIRNAIDGIRALITGIVQIVGIVAVLVLINPLIFVSLLVVCFISAVLSAIAANKEFEVWNNSLVKVGRKLGYFQELATNFTYAKEMRINKLQNWISDKMFGTAVKIIKGITTAVLIFTVMGMISGTLFALQDGGIYMYLARLASTNKISIGDFTVYINAIGLFIATTLLISSNIIMLQKSGMYIKIFLDYLDIQEEHQSEPDHKNLIQNDSNKEMNILFEDVWFQYPGQSEYILQGINIEMKNASKLVIVGENGAGKTTLIKLLLRLYKPTKGTIYLNGQDINEIDFKHYMQKVSAVFQDFKILSFSIMENIIFDKEESSEEVYKILDEVGLKDYVEKTPKGLNTQMGKLFDENGIELSGGQQQKLAIARALYKNTNLVVLDEPTAMLSPKAEYEIYSNFNDLTFGKTSIYISHRMSCCKFCDNIAVLEKGRIVEYGNHSKLIKMNGLYTKMFNLQAEFYRDLMGF